jgi:hypothetical protein
MALASCNSVISHEPWFSEATRGNPPQMLNGLWVADNDPTCRFDERQPIEKWPICATYIVVSDNEILTLDMTEAANGKRKTRSYGEWRGSAFILADGDPLISQSQDCDVGGIEAKADEPASPANQMTASPQKASPDKNSGSSIYCYSGIRPVAFDDDHKLIALKIWPILCLPAKPQSDGDEESDEAPLAFGLTREGNNCLANDRETLRRVARDSEATWARSGKTLPTMHWLRDGFH